MGSLILLLRPTCHPGWDLNGAPHPAGVGHWLLKVVQVRWFIVLILLVIVVVVLVLGVVITTTTAEVSRSTVAAAAAVAAVAAAGLSGAAGRGDVSVGEDVAELVLEVLEVSGSR